MHVHSHGPGSNSRAFAIGIGLNVLFIAVEIVFGLRARSLALLSDAGHNLSDVLALGLSWGAAMLAVRPPTRRHTYGMRRASILAALANAILLLIAVGGIAWEALRRLDRPEHVAGGTVMIVATVGIVLNGLTALLFWSGRKRDINLRSAFVHMAADAGVSLGVVLAGLAIQGTGWFWLDPAVSLGIGAVIIWGTWGLLRQSFDLAMDAVPETVDVASVEAYLRDIPGVTSVHDLHVWAMSTTETALTVHVIAPRPEMDDDRLTRISRELHSRFGIEHTTIQVERGDGGAECSQAPPDVV